MFDTILMSLGWSELYLANRLTKKKIMFDCVQLVRYMSAPIALRYCTLGPSNSLIFL